MFTYHISPKEWFYVAPQWSLRNWWWTKQFFSTSDPSHHAISKTWAAISVAVLMGVGMTTCSSHGAIGLMSSLHACRICVSHCVKSSYSRTARGCVQVHRFGSWWSTNQVCTVVEGVSPSQLKAVRSQYWWSSCMLSVMVKMFGAIGSKAGAAGLKWKRGWAHR